MRQITSLLREAATRRRLIGADNDVGGPPADHFIGMNMRAAPTWRASHAARRAACWVELMSAQARQALPHAQWDAQQPSPPIPHQTPSVRASADFTSQVMARLAATPPEPDPREQRARQIRTHVRRLAGVYMTLVLLAGVALLVVAMLAPWILLGVVAGIVSIALVAVTFAAFVSRLTGGVIGGFGVAYLAMLATLSSSLLLVARRTGRRATHLAHRR